jgi:hypothetical protein
MKTRHVTALLTALLLTAPAPAAEVRGRIARVDLEGGTIQLDKDRSPTGAPATLALAPSTRVRLGREPGAPADLKPGLEVRVRYARRRGAPVARLIRVGEARAARPAPGGGDVVAGTLQRIAVTDREVVIVGPGPRGAETETTVAVPEKTPITRAGKAISLDDLREGEKASVRVARRDGKLTALSVHAGPGAAPAAGAAGERPWVPRVRRALKLIDEVLRQMDRERE